MLKGLTLNETGSSLLIVHICFSDHDRTQTMRWAEPFTALSPVQLRAIRRNVQL